jgi:type VI secretion system FHA domain protein
VRPPKPVGTAPAVTVRDDLRAFLEGAGIEASCVTPEMLESLGAIVRTVVQGVVDILRARAEIRREFRMNVTLAQPDENNPLKFSANAEDALYNVLVKRNAAFLAAVPAFEEAFDDLRGHQLAMLKGMRAGYQHMLERFDPRTLERRFETSEKSSGLKGLMGGSKMWEHYRSWFVQTTEDEDDCFRRLFGDEFSEAYELEMQRLAGLRRKRRRES